MNVNDLPRNTIGRTHQLTDRETAIVRYALDFLRVHATNNELEELNTDVDTFEREMGHLVIGDCVTIHQSQVSQ